MLYNVVQLGDGRALGTVESGDPHGKPLFFFPGFGLSASAMHPNPNLATLAGVRLVAVDRPGIGMSSRLANRSLSKWPEDISELADKLGFNRFGVLGWSGGGPHALACAYRLGDRVSATGLFSCAPPFADKQAIASMPTEVKRLAFIARYAPVLLQVSFWNHCRQIREDADAYLLKSTDKLSKADQDIVRDPRYCDSLKKSMIEACHQGPRGLHDDMRAIARPWGFSLKDVRVPVLLWHGEIDKTIPVEVGRYLAGTLSNSSAKFLPNAGHFSYLTHWSQILHALVTLM
ncbi:MAG TPA: alpha/beta hydrolase [Steroidobacteraceae bacterium]